MDSAYWKSGAVAAHQLANTLCMLFYDIHINKGTTLNFYYIVCILFVDVELYRTSLALPAM